MKYDTPERRNGRFTSGAAEASTDVAADVAAVVRVLAELIERVEHLENQLNAARHTIGEVLNRQRQDIYETGMGMPGITPWPD